MLNSKIVVGGIVAAFAIIVGIFAFSGSIFIDDVSGGSLISTSETTRQVLPLEIELEDISILEINDRAAVIEVQFKVTNPNFKSVILQQIIYELYENNVSLSSEAIGTRPTGMLDTSNYFIVLSEKTIVFKDKVTIKNSDNLPELWVTLTKNTPQWKIKGEAFYNLSSMTSGGQNQITFEFTK